MVRSGVEGCVALRSTASSALQPGEGAHIPMASSTAQDLQRAPATGEGDAAFAVGDRYDDLERALPAARADIRENVVEKGSFQSLIPEIAPVALPVAVQCGYRQSA